MGCWREGYVALPSGRDMYPGNRRRAAPGFASLCAPARIHIQPTSEKLQNPVKPSLFKNCDANRVRKH